MNSRHSSRLAQRYARAYLNCFDDQRHHPAVDGMQAYSQLRDAIADNRQLIFFLRLPQVPAADKVRVLMQLRASTGAPDSVDRLIALLVFHRRAYLLPAVISQIITQYQQRHCLMPFTIATSAPLPRAAQQIVDRFLSRATGHAILADYRVDPELIAGMRLQSATVLWEHSIQKQLREIQLSFSGLKDAYGS